LLPWILPLVIVLIWQLACATGFVSRRVLPHQATALAGWKLVQSGELARNHLVSFWRASIGFLIGGSIGFSLGLANGLSQLSNRMTDTTIADGPQHPHLALIRWLILWFGIDETAKLFLVRSECSSDYINTLARHPHRRSAIDRDGPHLWHDRARIVSPGDLPRRVALIFVGLRFALGIHVG